MRIYCNSNVFGRPFDDLNQKRVLNETIASFKVFSLSKLDFVSIVTSEVLLAKASLIEDESKREWSNHSSQAYQEIQFGLTKK